jgi:hypothetical protein
MTTLAIWIIPIVSPAVTEARRRTRISQSLKDALRTSGNAAMAETSGTEIAPHEKTTAQVSATPISLSRTIGAMLHEATAAMTINFSI